MVPAGTQRLILGLYSSAFASAVPLPSVPPAARTVPFWRSVAVCSSRPVIKLAAADHTPLVSASAVDIRTESTLAMDTRISKQDTNTRRRMAPRLSRSGRTDRPVDESSNSKSGVRVVCG